MCVCIACVRACVRACVCVCVCVCYTLSSYKCIGHEKNQFRVFHVSVSGCKGIGHVKYQREEPIEKGLRPLLWAEGNKHVQTVTRTLAAGLSLNRGACRMDLLVNRRVRKFWAVADQRQTFSLIKTS